MFQLQPHVHNNRNRSDKATRLHTRITDKQKQGTIQKREKHRPILYPTDMVLSIHQTLP